MRVSQKLFFSSLSSRLKYVQQSLVILSKNSFYPKLNSEEKLLLVINLKNFFFLEDFYSFVSTKNNGFSFFFSFPLIYNLSSELMINTSLLCALDFHSDKRCFSFKPFRDSADVFFEIKSILSKKLNAFVCSIRNDLLVRSNLNDSWLLKNLSLERKVLCCWFNAQSTLFKTMSERLQKSLYNDLYLNLINFLLYGLLWI